MNNESMLQKDFKQRDIQRMRNLISKKYGDKVSTQTGYVKQVVEHKEGDVWEENNKTWTIKNGIKITITKLDTVKKSLQIPLTCPNCHKSMVNTRLNKNMYAIHNMCFDCVITHETHLKNTGKFEEYQHNIIKQGIKYHIIEIEGALLELALTDMDESFVTEAGDAEKWKGNGVNKQKIMEELQEYLTNLKSSII